MKLAGKRLRLGAAALLTTIALGAIITPGIVSADTSGAAPSVQHPETNNKCYEQVTAVQVRATEVQDRVPVRQVHAISAARQAQERELVRLVRHHQLDLLVVGTASGVQVPARPRATSRTTATSMIGPLGPVRTDVEHESKRVWQLRTTGETRQTKDGVESTSWLTAPPTGAGWVQIDQQTVNGNEVPCDDVETKKVTLCHATSSESNPYEKITVSVSAFINAGHIDHDGDIYEAFSYVKHGKPYSVAAKGETSLLQYDECERPKARQAELSARSRGTVR